MADTIQYRTLRLARAGFEPPEIAAFLNISMPTVLASLANLSADGASQEQRIIGLVYAGHHPNSVAQWLGVTVTVVLAALQDLTVDPIAAASPIAGTQSPGSPLSA